MVASFPEFGYNPRSKKGGCGGSMCFVPPNKLRYSKNLTPLLRNDTEKDMEEEEEEEEEETGEYGQNQNKVSVTKKKQMSLGAHLYGGSDTISDQKNNTHNKKKNMQEEEEQRRPCSKKNMQDEEHGRPCSHRPNEVSGQERWSSSGASDTTTSSTSISSTESQIHPPGGPRSAPARTSVSAQPPIKPHKAHDSAWSAIRSLQLQHGDKLSISNFRLLKRIGHGDIGSVFLAHIRPDPALPKSAPDSLFAIKVMDKQALALRNKVQRMHMEKEILACLDHPFLPTLYAHFDTDQFSSLVMDFCPGGDLYALRQKQPRKRFGLVAARFYAAEVLLALEYLHMLGIVYRDLKPENVLVRSDGHIMLTDFDLSLKCDVQPQLLKHTIPLATLPSSSSAKKRLLRSFSQSSTMSASSTTSFLHHGASNCMLPAACSIHPILSCLSLSNGRPQKEQISSDFGAKNKVKSSDRYKQSPKNTNLECEDDRKRIGGVDDVIVPGRRSTKSKNENDEDDGRDTLARTSVSCAPGREEDLMFMELVAEPTEARSMSFVGTHEYLAPEILSGNGHGSPVDWWTFGIFLYELLFGRTPFKGTSNEKTLMNIIKQEVKFPDWAEFESGQDAKSLIKDLLVKDPRKRLGSLKGAGEIKQHPFFKGVNWALVRCTQPPEVPKKISNASQTQHQNPVHQIKISRRDNPHQDSVAKVHTINRGVTRAHNHFDFF